MAQEDFSIESLASYLHLNVSQVQRMVDRGRLPGRRIGGQWRFSQAEVHHWLEERIGALDDESELAQVETVLHHAEGTCASSLSVAEILPREAVAIPLEARTRDSVISRIVQLASGSGLLWDPEKMADAVRLRENIHPTALDNGVALLHPRRPQTSILAEPFLAFGRTWQGIPFGHSRGLLTDIFFLICSTDDRNHLQVLARLSRLIGDPAAMDGIRAAEDADALLGVIAEFESSLFPDE